MKRGAAAALALSGVLLAAPAPLQDQDVVRMLVRGLHPAEIATLVRASPVDFDLSEEMISELKFAGVSDELLGVMRARQAEMEPVTPPRPAPAPPPLEELTLLIASSAAREGQTASLFYPDRLEDDLARPLGVGPKPEERKVTELAVFLACTTADHVPDHWRSASPLGEDFASAPRHQILVFRAGAAHVEPREVPSQVRNRFPEPRRDDPPRGWLRLELPPQSVALESGVAHDLLFGVAIRVVDRYLVVSQAERRGYVPRAGEPIRARVAQGKSVRAPVEVSLVELERDEP